MRIQGMNNGNTIRNYAKKWRKKTMSKEAFRSVQEQVLASSRRVEYKEFRGKQQIAYIQVIYINNNHNSSNNTRNKYNNQ